MHHPKIPFRSKSLSALLSLGFLFGFVFLLSKPAAAVQVNRLYDPSQVVILPEIALQAPKVAQTSMVDQAKMSKMDLALVELVQANQSNPLALEKIVTDNSFRLEQGKVQVKVVAAQGEQDAASLAVSDAGGVVTFYSAIDSILQAWVPVSELDAVAENPAVAFLQQPSYLVEQDDIQSLTAESEGLAAMNGPAWHNKSYRGHNVRVAIIDGGFAGYPALMGSDLPGNLKIKNFVDGESDDEVDGTSKHGTACAEIAADIAPQAQFYLIKIATDLDLEQAVNYAISQDVDVISTSVGWYNLTPGDGSGYFADLVNKARNKGIIWATAAGNDRESHWGGLFNDPDSDKFHNFSGSQEVNYFGPGNGDAYLINPGFPLVVFVRWDDWTAVTQDFALHILRWNGSNWEYVKTSNRPQNGLPGQTPTEAAAVTTSGGPAPYGFVIERKNSNRNVDLEIFAPKMPRLDELVRDRSLSNLADAENVLTIGALNSSSPYSLESYSAQGPTNGPGGIAFGGLTKPDFSAYAGVSTEVYGFRSFSGTSAAAPHAAGAAALVKGAYSNFSPQDIENFLVNRAVDMGGLGLDNVYGHGRLYLGPPPNPTAGLNYHSFIPMSLG